MNEIITTKPADQFRAKASSMLADVANQPLHALVDEFQRLTDVMDGDSKEDAHGRDVLGDAGQLASRERKLINGAARARFGIEFAAHDRSNAEDNGW